MRQRNNYVVTAGILLILLFSGLVYLWASGNSGQLWNVFPVYSGLVWDHLAVYEEVIVWKHAALGPFVVTNTVTGESQNLSLPCEVNTNIPFDVYGDWLVGVFQCNYPAPDELRAYNLSTQEWVLIEPPPNAPPEQVWPDEPAIYGDKIVWYMHENGQNVDLYLFDLQTRTATALSNNGNPIAEINPDIYEEWVVWDRLDFNAVTHDIIAYHLTTTEVITISTPNTANFPYPKIYNNLIVWSDDRNGPNNADIYGYDLDTRELVPIITAAEEQYDPWHDGNVLVYKQTAPNYELDIIAHDLETGESAFLFHGPTAYVNDIRIHAGLAAWEAEQVIYGARQLKEKVFLPALSR